MKFFISRTSVWNSDKQPCEGAVLEQVDCWDQRGFKTPEEHDERLRERWFDRGSDHGINSVGIYRKVEPKQEWVIESDSLESLLLSLNERVIIEILDDLDQKSNPEIKFAVEIYDDYCYSNHLF